MIVLLAAVAYLFVCLITYSADDPGPTHTGSGAEVSNMGGRVGAWIADLLFTLFGRMSFLFLLLTCITVWRVYRERGIGSEFGWNFFLPISGFITALAGACGLEHIYFPLDAEQSTFLAGGIIGQYISAAFLANFGIIGATLILIGLLIAGITLVGHVSWFELMDRLGYRAFFIAGWLKQKVEDGIDRKKVQRSENKDRLR